MTSGCVDGGLITSSTSSTVISVDTDDTTSSSSSSSSSNKETTKPPSSHFLLKHSRLNSVTNVGMMCLVLVGGGMAFSLYSPFFPNEGQRKGMSPTTIGVLFGCYQLVMFVGISLSSKAVQLLGLRYMIWAGTLLAGGSTALFGVLDLAPSGTTTYTVMCFALRVVEAIGASLYLTASYSISGKVCPNSIAFVYALLETGNAVGWMIGASSGGFLYEAYGFYLPFICLGAILIVIGLFTTFFIPASVVSRSRLIVAVTTKSSPGDRHKNSDDTTESDTSDATAILTSPSSNDDNINERKKSSSSVSLSRLFRLSVKAWIVTVAEITASILSSYPEPTISIYLETLGLTDKATLGNIFLASSIVYTISCISSGHLADRFKDHVYWLMSVGALLSGVSFFVMGPAPFVASTILAPSLAMTATAEIVLYIGIALLMIPVPRVLLNISKEIGFSEGLETSAMIAGLYNGIWSMGGFVGPILAGYLLETVGFQWGATIMSATALLLIPVFTFAANYKVTKPSCSNEEQGDQNNAIV